MNYRETRGVSLSIRPGDDALLRDSENAGCDALGQRLDDAQTAHGALDRTKDGEAFEKQRINVGELPVVVSS